MTRSVLVVVGLAQACVVYEPNEDGVCGDIEVLRRAHLQQIEACEVINGDLRIEDQGWVEAVDLPLLEEVEGGLLLGDLEALERIELPSLVSAGRITIENAPALSRLELNALLRSGTMTFSGIDELSELILPTLHEQVGEDLSIHIRENAQLERVSMPSLSALIYEGTDTGETSRIALLMEHNPALTTLDLPNLEIASAVLHNNDALVNLEGLGALETVFQLRIEDCDSFVSFEGLGARDIDTLHLSANDALEDLRGLESLSRVSSLQLQDNPSLASLEALGADAENVSVGSEGVWIENNPLLEDLGFLSGLTITSDPHHPGCANLRVVESPGLTDLTGLDALTSVEGTLQLAHNDNLTSLEGLGALTAAGERLEDFFQTYYYGGLSIKDDDALMDLAGLESLEVVWGYLEIVNNDSLTSLQGLDNLTGVYGGELTISGNPMLCQEDAEAFAASIEAWHGVTVENNGTGRTDCGS